MIPTWIVNKATKTFAPKVVENLIKVGPKYTEWKSKNSPDAKPWLATGEKYWWEKEEKAEKSTEKSGKEKSSTKLLSPDTTRNHKSPRKGATSRSPRKKKDKSTENSRSEEK